MDKSCACSQSSDINYTCAQFDIEMGKRRTYSQCIDVGDFTTSYIDAGHEMA
jgi:hypothetical protein